MDNAGENKLLEQYINKLNNELDISAEYTARKTPQQNLPAEQAFKTIYGKKLKQLLVGQMFRWILGIKSFLIGLKLLQS